MCKLGAVARALWLAPEPLAESGRVPVGPRGHPRRDVEGLGDLLIRVPGEKRKQDPGEEGRHPVIDPDKGLHPLSDLGASVSAGLWHEGQERE